MAEVVGAGLEVAVVFVAGGVGCVAVFAAGVAAGVVPGLAVDKVAAAFFVVGESGAFVPFCDGGVG